MIARQFRFHSKIIKLRTPCITLIRSTLQLDQKIHLPMNIRIGTFKSNLEMLIIDHFFRLDLDSVQYTPAGLPAEAAGGQPAFPPASATAAHFNQDNFFRDKVTYIFHMVFFSETHDLFFSMHFSLKIEFFSKESTQHHFVRICLAGRNDGSDESSSAPSASAREQEHGLCSSSQTLFLLHRFDLHWSRQLPTRWILWFVYFAIQIFN